ncbi:MAG: glycosyltransferase [Clostridia bacterium]|nr:glycosyltransferase [Clostridia bacterium]
MSKNLKTACVIGHFGFGLDLLNGQTVKTKILSEELEKRFPDGILKIDTHGGIKSLIKAPFHVLKALKRCKNVIILPAHNGLRVYAPLLALMRPLYKGRRLHYAVIGGWLASFLENKKGLEKNLKKFDGVYVETSTMKNALEAKGFENVLVMPNCKELKILSPEELSKDYSEPYKLCTFSRVMKEKGIEDAVNAVKAVNEKASRVVYSLDIYGQIDGGQTEWFESLKASFPEYIRYGGLVPFDKSVEVLKDYYALLFTTRFFTEGIPGTVIDAYAAGIPVVSARWESFADIIDEGMTGMGYTIENVNELTSMLENISSFTESVDSMRKNCLVKAEQYLPRKALNVMVERM